MYGGFNQFGFGIGSFTGMILLTVLNIYSRRVIHRMHISRSGVKVTFDFFSALWVPKSRTFNVTEISGASPSYGNFTRTEVVSLGNVWLMKESNAFITDPEIQYLVEMVINGYPVSFHQSEERK